MVYPTSSGELNTAIKFELAAEGLELYRLLKFIEAFIEKNEGSSYLILKAQKLMNELNKKYLSSALDHENEQAFLEIKSIVLSFFIELDQF